MSWRMEDREASTSDRTVRSAAAWERRWSIVRMCQNEKRGYFNICRSRLLPRASKAEEDTESIVWDPAVNGL